MKRLWIPAFYNRLFCNYYFRIIQETESKMFNKIIDEIRVSCFCNSCNFKNKIGQYNKS